MSPEVLLHKFGYLAVFVGTFLEGETILVMAGFFAERGYLKLPFVIATACCGAYSGHVFWFWLGRTQGVREISREDNLRHTAAFRLALGRSIPSLQASWVKMGIDAATEALRWGVNDLGGTLMEESISRMAGSQHGVKLDPDDLVGAAHRAGRPAAERSTLYEILRRYELPRMAA